MNTTSAEKLHSAPVKACLSRGLLVPFLPVPPVVAVPVLVMSPPVLTLPLPFPLPLVCPRRWPMMLPVRRSVSVVLDRHHQDRPRDLRDGNGRPGAVMPTRPEPAAFVIQVVHLLVHKVVVRQVRRIVDGWGRNFCPSGSCPELLSDRLTSFAGGRLPRGLKPRTQAAG